VPDDDVGPIQINHLSRLASNSGDQGHILRPLLALGVQLDFKRDPLANLRPAATARGERLDVDKDGLPALRGLNEAKAPVVLPGLDDACEWHGVAR